MDILSAISYLIFLWMFAKILEGIITAWPQPPPKPQITVMKMTLEEGAFPFIDGASFLGQRFTVLDVRQFQVGSIVYYLAQIDAGEPMVLVTEDAGVAYAWRTVQPRAALVMTIDEKTDRLHVTTAESGARHAP